MSEEPNTPEQNEGPAVPMKPGPTGEAGSAVFQRQPNGANPDGAPQNAAEYDVLPVVPECGYCHNLQAPPSEEVM